MPSNASTAATVSSTERSSLDALFDALANEQRRDMVHHLSRGESTTPELARRYRMTKQALSRHVAVLEAAGLVSRIRLGRVDQLALVSDRLGDLTDWVAELRAGWTASFDRLAGVLDATDR